MDPVNKCTTTILARLPAKYLNSVLVNINIGSFGTAPCQLYPLHPQLNPSVKKAPNRCFS